MRPMKITLTLLMITTIILSGCHFPSRPWVLAEITNHTDGGSVVINQEVRIITQGRSSQGIDKVQLFINGELEHTDEPPMGNPLAYTADQPWIPDTEGQVIVSVIAIDRSGNLSDPFIILQVVPSIDEMTNGFPTRISPNANRPGKLYKQCQLRRTRHHPYQRLCISRLELHQNLASEK